MKLYMTFGSGQPLAGKCLPLICDDEIQARQYMYAKYNGKWAFTYTEDGWEKTKQNLLSMGFFPETELGIVDIRGWKNDNQTT